MCLRLSIYSPLNLSYLRSHPLPLPPSLPLLSQLVYCLAHFKGDEKVPSYIHQLIDPSEQTEPPQEGGRSRDSFFGFTEDDYLALLTKNPETLFQDDSYMKHLRRHATK